MNICHTTILLNNGKHYKGKSKRFKGKFQGFRGLFCFSNRLINREIRIWRRPAVEPGREKRLRGCWTLSESADSVAQRAVVRAAFKSRMLFHPSELLHLNQASIQPFIGYLTDAHASAFRNFHKGALYFRMDCCREDRTLLEVVTPINYWHGRLLMNFLGCNKI